MTYSSKELRAQGVHEERIALRRFRRTHRDHRGKPLDLGEAAAMIGINRTTLARYELGETAQPRAATMACIRAFLARWKGH
jgi:transcriptional regulator with XRE-family HTH domain